MGITLYELRPFGGCHTELSRALSVAREDACEHGIITHVSKLELVDAPTEQIVAALLNEDYIPESLIESCELVCTVYKDREDWPARVPLDDM